MRDRWQVLRYAILPSALPGIITGLRVGAGFAFRGLVFAEIIAAKTGIGYLIFEGTQTQQTARTIVGMIVMGLTWLAIDLLLPAAARARDDPALGPHRRRGAAHVSARVTPRCAPRERQSLCSARCRSCAILVAWWLLPHVVQYPSYMLPPISAVLDFAWESIRDGTLAAATSLASLARLAAGFVIGMALAIPLGLAIALNRHVADMFRPVLSFLQAIAGIAWVPLTIIWFGIGNGSVIFVIANTIFFASLYNTVIGVQSIPTSLLSRRAQPRRQRHCAADQPDPARRAGADPARRAHVDGLRLARAGRLGNDRRQQRARLHDDGGGAVAAHRRDHSRHDRHRPHLGASWTARCSPTIERRTVGRWGLLQR